MCGIVGYLGFEKLTLLEARVAISEMCQALSHRGPDDYGNWIDESSQICLAHTRLSILDLSLNGHQPMLSVCGRYILIFNGEIYNHLSLRNDLSKLGFQDWRGESDTETLLAGFSKWGIKKTIQLSVGMFAFAVWDKEKQELILGRDRMGEKPLYYGWQSADGRSSFLFGSELKALKAHPAFKADIDRDALSLFMRSGYIEAPYSIYKGIFKLPPGSLLSISLNERKPVIDTYWSFTEVAITGNRTFFKYSSNEIIDELEDLLKSAVHEQMVADVPLGAFLSGGIDSSTIVALMQSQSNQPVKTFTIGFGEKDYDEASYAAAVAHHLGTDHTELYVTADDAINVIPKLPSLYCEPFADPSQIPTFLVSQLARQKVLVSLSGDGGDELFAGYNRYIFTHSIWRVISHLPLETRRFIASNILRFPPDFWSKLLGSIQPVLPRSFRGANKSDKLQKGAKVLTAENVDDLYSKLNMYWQPEDVVIKDSESMTSLNKKLLVLDGLDSIQRMMVKDSTTYLPDDILVKLDRATMGVSLEGRAPFLNHRVVEFAWRVPQSLKLRDGVGKWILRQVLHRYIPKELIERPKMGFGVPIDSWLRGPLKGWADQLLDKDRLTRDGYLNAVAVRKKWEEHLSGKRNWQYLLWNVLMFQAWLDEQKS